MMELSNEIKELEGHLSWMDEIICELFADRKQKTDFIRDLLSKKCDFNEEWEMSSSPSSSTEEIIDLHSNWEEDCNDESPKYAGLFAIQLNKSAMNVYLGEFDEALKILDQLQNFLGKLTGEHERLLPVMKYALESLKYSISKILETSPSLTVSINNGCKLNELKKTWSSFHENKTSCAVIYYLKGSLERELRLFTDDQKFQMITKVLDLDPDYHIWYHYAYHKVRGMRLNRDRSVKAPSKEEAAFCKKAYQLSPNIALNMFNMALLLKDILWSSFFKVISSSLPFESRSKNVKDTYAESLAFLNKGLQIVEEKSLRKWMIKIISQKAELMLYYGEQEEEQLQGIDILIQSLERWPNEDIFHQKIGRLYLHGIPGSQKKEMCQDYDKCRFHLKRALELQNYKFIGSVRDYIKLFKKNAPQAFLVEEALDILTKCLEASTVSCQKRQISLIRIWRGCIYWIYSPVWDVMQKQAACRDWLYVIENCPDDKENLFSTIQRPPFFVQVQGEVKFGKICSLELEKALLELQVTKSNSSKELESINEFLVQVKWMPQKSNRWSTDYRFGDSLSRPKESHYSSSSNSNVNSKDQLYGRKKYQLLNQTENWRKIKTGYYFGKSKADVDNDWRSNKT